jgi:hypothetical protein
LPRNFIYGLFFSGPGQMVQPEDDTALVLLTSVGRMMGLDINGFGGPSLSKGPLPGLI